MSSQVYEFIAGTAGVRAKDIGHLIVAGRIFGALDDDLLPFADQRADTAGAFYADYGLTGSIVTGGREAERSAATLLKKWQLHRGVVRAETQALEPVTGLVYAQRLLPRDGAPVGIVAQQQHLAEHLLAIIAPAIMDRPYAGLVAPELSDNPDQDNLFDRYTSEQMLRDYRSE